MAEEMVDHPPHYTRGPVIKLTNHERNSVAPYWRAIECIEVIRRITDMRLANAMKYIWRVAFGGKENNRQDIQKAIWYLTDWLDYPLDD